MATVTINAEYAARHCKARLTQIEKEFGEARECWFKCQRGQRRKRGHWPFRYWYFPTEGELEALFRSSDDWYSPEERLRGYAERECGVLRGIIEATNVAAKAGASEITLDSDEIKRLERITGEKQTA